MKDKRGEQTSALARAKAAVTREQLLGATDAHVVSLASAVSSKVKLQPAAINAYEQMREAASAAGFRLQVASGFRDFQRQKTIWNKKLNASDESSRALEQILHWSALPGTSRHHWGTDFDFFDEGEFPPFQENNRTLQLLSSEYQPNGPCHALYQWLLKHAPNYGFYWPYQGRGNGVAAEPWHLSYAPLAAEFQALWGQPEQIGYLRDFLHSQELAGFSLISEQLASIIQRYSLQVESPPKEIAL
ncbi:D-alanyl-D-alanine carboxypeptidase [Aliidiomarina iranensis]|uniref:D-alanyl-D-alanine carboxypeptidase n=1 Tax=Aliidiomarina iranensis TaxID=1434071 RepID=A0A432VZP5_9GAMM|nr:M15 family metallopeptidase [Aliidiomarina iranensis]RUO22221.1 D-alanyl-D-alanine carboxypeptidase [Aliidiomarina iranensis]